MAGMNVVLLAATPGKEHQARLGATRSGPGGAFSLRYQRTAKRAVKYLVATRPGGAAEAGFPVPASAYRLAAVIGAGRPPMKVTVNERTTVAAAYAMAQFLRGNRLAGKNPGLRNAAAMARNLVRVGDGGLSPVLKRFPNGGATSTLPSFDSLANTVVACRFRNGRCARLLQLAGLGKPAGDTLQALLSIAHYPWHSVGPLFRLARRVRPAYRPSLGAGDRPDAWTLALRFEGDGESISGPGNFAIDAGGNVWATNNYEFSRNRHQPVCGAQNLLRFTPTGRFYPGSPYTGGGLSGAGFGISIDPANHVWVGNFGFAAPECPTQPPHNSVSEFTIGGKPLSPGLEEFPAGSAKFRGGFEAGEISWPQGTVSDQQGNIWIASCANGNVAIYPGGDPAAARVVQVWRLGVGAPFDIAFNGSGEAFVTGNSTSTVGMLGPTGLPSGHRIEGGGLDKPLGIAADSSGNMWVANSAAITIPCETESATREGEAGAVLIKPNGELAREKPFTGAGMTVPWGIAVDGDDNVWVANFGGRRLSELCGTQPQLCPPGKRRTGAPISPNDSGYGFDGLVRNTGVAIDPSGNVWVANNWKNVPVQTNPGGYQVVAFLGLAAPIKTPLIGPPQQP
jgi:sugar lactone lactonase YvrE